MRTVVFGATGRTGRLLVDGALDRGHEVTAFVRDPRGPAALFGAAAQPRVAHGDILDPVPVAEAVAGSEAILFAVGPASLRARTTLNSQGMLNVVHAMQRHRVRRLVVLSAVGLSPEHDPNVAWTYERVVKPLFHKGHIVDLRRMEVIVRQSGLDWTIVRPPRLTDGPPRGSLRYGPGYSLPGSGKVERADVARFMLDQLESDENRGHAVAVTY
jgi:uncharacterized protein YbjT (DUF2867 family)